MQILCGGKVITCTIGYKGLIQVHVQPLLQGVPPLQYYKVAYTPYYKSPHITRCTPYFPPITRVPHVTESRLLQSVPHITESPLLQDTFISYYRINPV